MEQHTRSRFQEGSNREKLEGMVDKLTDADGDCAYVYADELPRFANHIIDEALSGSCRVAPDRTTQSSGRPQE